MPTNTNPELDLAGVMTHVRSFERRIGSRLRAMLERRAMEKAGVTMDDVQECISRALDDAKVWTNPGSLEARLRIDEVVSQGVRKKWRTPKDILDDLHSRDSLNDISGAASHF